MSSTPDTDTDIDDERQDFDPLNQPAPKFTDEAKQLLKRRAGRPRKGQEKPATGSYEAIWTPTKRMDGTPGPQYALLSCPFQEIFFGGARGGGKSLPMDENVLTPAGYRQMKDIWVNDWVCAPDGGQVKVIGVYPQGSETVYRIKLATGATIRASAGHLWRVRTDGVEELATTHYVISLLRAGLKPYFPVRALTNWVEITSIEYDGIAQTQCIKVDSDDGLFIANDEIITHNTDGAIGKWLQHAGRYGENAKGVFFRRRFKQLEEVQSRCSALFSRLGAAYNKGDATWVFPNKATLKLRHLWDVAATEEYQGHNYCVARGTPVLMEDGSYKPIETVLVGEKVMTLEGPKPVTGRMTPKVKSCVLAEVFDQNGRKIGEQIHPEDHPVLTTFSGPPSEHSSTSQASLLPREFHASVSEQGLLLSESRDPASRHNQPLSFPIVQGPDTLRSGSYRTAPQQSLSPSPWQSYKTLLDVHRESQEDASCPGDDRSGYTGSAGERLRDLPLPALSVPVVLHGLGLLSDGQCQQTSTQYHTSGISCGWSAGPSRESSMGCVDQKQQIALDQSYLSHSKRHLPDDGREDAQIETRKVSDCPDDYSTDHHLCGEPVPCVLENAPTCAPLPDDVGTRIRTDERMDVLERIEVCNQQDLVSYIHPYTGKDHKVHQDYRFGHVVFQPCGLHEVFDLTVQDANHYITESQLVNRNSFLCFEELTNWPSPDSIDRMRGTLRSAAGVPVQLIMTGNPGGSGHCVPYGLVKTPDGWKEISEFEVGDPVMTVTPFGELVESRVSQVHRSHYRGPMATITGSGLSMMFTPNHKLAVRGDGGKLDLVPFEDLPDTFSIPRSVTSKGETIKLDHYLRGDVSVSTDSTEYDDYNGEVYCIGVPETHSFIIQQNGCIWISGNSWVKQRYISPSPAGWTPIKDLETGEYRIYIPSRLEDNAALMKNDPNYGNRLRATGSESLVRAWLGGDWDIVSGGFFDDLIQADRHFLDPFDIPMTWTWRRSFDWGSSAPASLGIWAISDGNPVEDLGGFVFPRGSLIRVREWYSVARDARSGDIQPNVGQRLTNLALGSGIAQRSMGYRFSGCVADPAIYNKLGRESIYDEMKKGAKEAGHNLIFSPADNSRIAGWQKMRDMLENSAQEVPEKPGLWVMTTCTNWLRTVPVLQRSDHDQDDVDTTQEDHIADDTRYACQTGARSMKVGDLVGR